MNPFSVFCGAVTDKIGKTRDTNRIIQTAVHHLVTEVGDTDRIQADLEELYTRVVFNVITANRDDHLRNHGFLYESPDGWRLAPAYDLNPVPTDLKPRVLTTAIDVDDATASLELALSVADYFELSGDQARATAADVGAAVSTWRKEASALGLSNSEIERMASAFEHKDLEAALRS